jgi:GDP-4-dehydro-6-deoxy-D-mannose reductase
MGTLGKFGRNDPRNGGCRFAEIESTMNSNVDFRVIITGGDGFVAPFAARAILSSMKKARVLLTARRAIIPPDGCEFVELDILNGPAVSKLIKEFNPTHILHLAGIASRGAAEANPAAAWNVNVCATLELAEKLKMHCAGSTFLFVSSSQVYDSNHQGLISESAPIGPTGVYPSTKAAADLALGAMTSGEMRIVRFRPFNHTGPGQADIYAFGNFAKQIATIEAGLQPPVLRVGNLDIERDFLDVRDVADAYACGIACSSQLPQNSVFNLASGQPRPIRHLLKAMIAHSRVKIDVQVDSNFQRGPETPIIVGDGTAARKALNWSSLQSIETTMREMLDFARKN